MQGADCFFPRREKLTFVGRRHASGIRPCLCLQDDSAAATVDGSLATRMANKRKSVAIPVDFALRRSVRSVDEVSDFILHLIAAHLSLLLTYTLRTIYFTRVSFAHIHFLETRLSISICPNWWWLLTSTLTAGKIHVLLFFYQPLITIRVK